MLVWDQNSVWFAKEIPLLVFPPASEAKDKNDEHKKSQSAGPIGHGLDELIEFGIDNGQDVGLGQHKMELRGNHC